MPNVAANTVNASLHNLFPVPFVVTGQEQLFLTFVDDTPKPQCLVAAAWINIQLRCLCTSTAGFNYTFDAGAGRDFSSWH